MVKNYVPSPWASQPGTEQMSTIDIGHLRELLNKVNQYELNDVVNKIHFETPYPEEHPIFSSGETKTQKIEYLVRWVARHPNAKASGLLFQKLQEKLGEKEAYPVRGPVPGTKYITWKDFTRLKSYPLIAKAVEYRHDYRKRCNPQTKDGYVSVDAIYNMSSWASWKSSSLGAGERAIANAIQDLKLLELMKLNKGRRSDQPALFPGGFLLGGAHG